MRRRHRHHKELALRTRDHDTIARPLRSVKIVKPAAVLRSFLSELEDRREFHPEGERRPARARRRPDAQLVPVDRPKPFVAAQVAPARVGFSRPSGVVLCVRRNVRRQVLHAKGKAGSYHPGRWSEYSYVDCTDAGGHRFKRR